MGEQRDRETGNTKTIHCTREETVEGEPTIEEMEQRTSDLFGPRWVDSRFEVTEERQRKQSTEMMPSTEERQRKQGTEEMQRNQPSQPVDQEWRRGDGEDAYRNVPERKTLLTRTPVQLSPGDLGTDGILSPPPTISCTSFDGGQGGVGGIAEGIRRGVRSMNERLDRDLGRLSVPQRTAGGMSKAETYHRETEEAVLFRPSRRENIEGGLQERSSGEMTQQMKDLIKSFGVSQKKLSSSMPQTVCEKKYYSKFSSQESGSLCEPSDDRTASYSSYSEGSRQSSTEGEVVRSSTESIANQNMAKLKRKIYSRKLRGELVDPRVATKSDIPKLASSSKENNFLEVYKKWNESVPDRMIGASVEREVFGSISSAQQPETFASDTTESMHQQHHPRFLSETKSVSEFSTDLQRAGGYEAKMHHSSSYSHASLQPRAIAEYQLPRSNVSTLSEKSHPPSAMHPPRAREKYEIPKFNVKCPSGTSSLPPALPQRSQREHMEGNTLGSLPRTSGSYMSDPSLPRDYAVPTRDIQEGLYRSQSHPRDTTSSEETTSRKRESWQRSRNLIELEGSGLHQRPLQHLSDHSSLQDADDNNYSLGASWRNQREDGGQSSTAPSTMGVLLSDHSSHKLDDTFGSLPLPLDTCSDSQRSSPLSLSDGSNDEGTRSKGKQIETLTSASWQGRFLMERDCAADDWGASDESITFVFVNPEETEDPPPETQLEDALAAHSNNYRSSSNLSQIGLSIGMPQEQHRTHSYDLYKSNGGRLNRTTSLDSISCALHKFKMAQLKTSLQRTCSLEEDVNQELEDILERGRLGSSAESISDRADAKELTSAQETYPHHANINPSEEQSIIQPQQHIEVLPYKTSDSTMEGQVSDVSEDDVFARSPSPMYTFGQTSWGDFKSLILGRPIPPASVRGMTGESSKSSPHLNRKRNTDSLGKKSVSWTDLKGCGALEMEVSEGMTSQVPFKTNLQLKSIMKKPNLTPIAPTPTPPTSRRPSLPFPTPSPTSPSQPDPQKSRRDSEEEYTSSQSRHSSEDDSLKDMFSLQLPQHIRNRVNNLSSPMREEKQVSDTGTSSRSVRTFDRERISHTVEAGSGQISSTFAYSPTMHLAKSSSITSPPGGTRLTKAFSSPSYTASKPHRVSISLGNSLSTEDGSSVGLSQYSDGSAFSTTSLYSGVLPASRATSSSGVSCSGFSSTGAISTPGGFSPLHEAMSTIGSHSSDVLQNSNLSALGGYSKSPVGEIGSLGRNMRSFQHHRNYSSVPSTPTEGCHAIPSSPDTTLSAPTTPSNDPSLPVLPLDRPENIPRCWSEGDLLMPSTGVKETWSTLSRVMQEAGTILKTLSETSLVLHQQVMSPSRKEGLPPVLEEGTSFSHYQRMSIGKKYSSVAVQTDHHQQYLRMRTGDAGTSLDSLSDSEHQDFAPRLPRHHRRYLPRSYEKVDHPDVPMSAAPHHSRKGTPLLREMKQLRQEREKINRLLGEYEGSYHNQQQQQQAQHRYNISSSSELDSPVSSVMASVQDVSGSEWGGASVGSQRCLAWHRQRLEESCYHLEESLRLSARRRQLRRQLLSSSHAHSYDCHDRRSMHGSLDSGRAPFCSSSHSPSPCLSSPSLPILPQSPSPSKDPACCCISPTHHPHHTHCRPPASSCSAHPHWSRCHAAPAPDLSYTPHCLNERLRVSRSACRSQLASVRHLASTTSLPAMPPQSHPPYPREHAVSLSSLPVASRVGGMSRRGLRGSLASLASEGEMDRRRHSRWRGYSESDSTPYWHHTSRYSHRY